MRLRRSAIPIIERLRAHSPRGVHPASGEEGRAFLQARLALFAKFCFALSLLLLVGTNATGIAMPSRTLYIPSSWSNLWHLCGALVSLGCWLLTRRREVGLGHRALVAIDVGGTALALGAYCALAGSISHEFSPDRIEAL